MISQIAIILLLLVLLYFLLRHWPETSEGPLLQTLNHRKPRSEEEQPVRQRAIKKNFTSQPWWKRAWAWLRELFSDDREAPVSAEPAPLMAPLPPTADDFDDFIAPAGRPATAPSAKPTDVDTLLGQADVAARNGDYDKAEDLLVKAVTIDPKNPKIYSKLGIIYLEQGENWKEADESFRQALKWDPNNGFIHNNLGLVLYNQDRFAAAAKEYELAIKADDGLPSRHANLGLAYLSLRQFAKAEQEFKRASRLDTENEEYKDLLKEAGSKRQSHRA